jgi:hypothetical protein
MSHRDYNYIRESTRRDIFDVLMIEKYSWSGRLSDAAFLSRIYDLDSMPSYDPRHETAAGDIARHREWNDDWTDDWVLTDDRFNLLKASDKQFLKFLTEMTHPVVQPDSEKVTWLVEILNGYLIEDGWQLFQQREIAGRPIFAAQRLDDDAAPPDTQSSPKQPVPEWQQPATIPPALPSPSSKTTLPVPTSVSPAPTRSKVFISYSHSDVRWLKRLQVHLAPLEREGKIDRWDDTRIRTSQQWRDEIRKAVDATKVAVLLVSADFLASAFIADNELPPLLAAAKIDGAFIMPVIISPCRFAETPTLSAFQAVNPPSSPLVGMRQHNREAVWVKLTNDIADALSDKLR